MNTESPSCTAAVMAKMTAATIIPTPLAATAPAARHCSRARPLPPSPRIGFAFTRCFGVRYIGCVRVLCCFSGRLVGAGLEERAIGVGENGGLERRAGQDPARPESEAGAQAGGYRAHGGQPPGGRSRLSR